MPQLDTGVIRDRAARLRARGEAARAARFAALTGSRQEILAEKNNLGHTRCFAPVHFKEPIPQGEIVTLAITGAGAGHLLGSPIPASQAT
jgi:threonylcarbamoyladenosine tRNA methylthiotransferase MtaB